MAASCVSRRLRKSGVASGVKFGRQELRAVELRAQPAGAVAQPDALAALPAETPAQLQPGARKAVVVRVVLVEGVTRQHGGNAVAGLAAEAQRIVEHRRRAAQRQVALARALAADGGVAAEVRVAFAAPRHDVDHAADGVGAVQAGARAAQDLDALRLGQADRGQVGLAERGRTHAHTVDQHQRVAGAAAADEHAGALPGSAVARQLDAAFAAQQVLDRVGAAGADALAVDDHHVGHDAAQRVGTRVPITCTVLAGSTSASAWPGTRGWRRQSASSARRGREHPVEDKVTFRIRTPRAGLVQDTAGQRRDGRAAAVGAQARRRLPAPPSATPASRASGRYPGLRVPVHTVNRSEWRLPRCSPSGCDAVRSSPTVAGAAPDWPRNLSSTHRLPVEPDTPSRGGRHLVQARRV